MLEIVVYNSPTLNEQEIAMQWNLEGLVIEGRYLGEFPVTGRVELSRFSYGGRIRHHVKLNTPVEVYGAIRDFVIMDHFNITRVRDNPQ